MSIHTSYICRVHLAALLSAGLLSGPVAGCRRTVIDSADRQVYRLIEQRQLAALGARSDANISSESGLVHRSGSLYSYAPHPVDSDVPDSFLSKSAPDQPAEGDTEREVEPPIDGASAGEEGIPPAEAISVAEYTESIFTEEEAAHVIVFGLNDALAYAQEHSRDLQDAKEDLYLAALDLTLERHLWTPQFVASIQGEFADYGQIRDFDRAMSTISEVAVSQRLPYGGDVTASIVSTLMRDLGRHITSGETGDFIISADIPLFRGAGRTARESLYQAQREIIYAVRTYERFRRSFLVDLATRYFNVQRAKANITNAHRSYLSRKEGWERAAYFYEVKSPNISISDAPRAKSILRDAESDLVSAKESYASALDRFKIRLGMPVDTLLDVIDQEDDEESAAIEVLVTEITEDEAETVAMRYRLDLINSLDAVDDAGRGVNISKNRILPDLALTGSVAMSTDPDQPNSMGYNTERTTWRGGLAFRMDDRKSERNDYRGSLIRLRRAQRRHEEAVDIVRADVRQALRRIAQQSSLRQIQVQNVRDNEFRYAVATERFHLGTSTNQDQVDAEDDLLRARNRYSSAVAAYRQAILEFRRDTGTLRVDPHGMLITSFDAP